MRQTSVGEHKRILLPVWALSAALALAGCSSASTGTPDATPSLSSRLSSYFTGPKEAPPPAAPAQPVAASVDCPGVDVRQGASTMNIAEPRGSALPAFVRPVRPRVHGGSRFIDHQGRRARPYHCRSTGRPRQCRGAAALRGGARRAGAAHDRDQVQAFPGDGPTGRDQYRLYRC